MWLESLQEFEKNNKQHLNFKVEYHLAIYITKILQGRVDFSMKKTKTKEFMVTTLHNEDKKKNLTPEQFYYWWQIERYDELVAEEEIILSDFNQLKAKIMKASQNNQIPQILDTDSEEETEKKMKQIEDHKQKVGKLNEALKKEADASNKKLGMLSQFRMMYTNTESLKRLLEAIEIILQNKG